MAEPTAIGTSEPFPQALKPMLATLTAEPFSDPKWLFEPKLDGFRILAFVRKGEVTLLTRNGNDFTGHYPWVVQDLSAYTDSEMVVDGEMAALNDKGLPAGLQLDAAQRRDRHEGAEAGGRVPYRVLPL